MIPTVQIEGAPDTHPETPVHDARELSEGAVDLSNLGVTGHHVRVFDLMDDSQRDAYEKLYVDLARKSRAGGIVVSCNTRETLSRPDGSTGWFKYVEWTEFDTSGILGA